MSISIVDIFLCPQLKLSIFVVDIDDFVSISIRACAQRYFGKLYQAYRKFFLRYRRLRQYHFMIVKYYHLDVLLNVIVLSLRRYIISNHQNPQPRGHIIL